MMFPIFFLPKKILILTLVNAINNEIHFIDIKIDSNKKFDIFGKHLELFFNRCNFTQLTSCLYKRIF